MPVHVAETVNWGQSFCSLDSTENRSFVPNPSSRRGWSALVRAVHPNGMLGNVQKIGDQPENTSADDTEICGTGALLLAGSEVYKLAR